MNRLKLLEPVVEPRQRIRPRGDNYIGIIHIHLGLRRRGYPDEQRMSCPSCGSLAQTFMTELESRVDVRLAGAQVRPSRAALNPVLSDPGAMFGEIGMEVNHGMTHNEPFGESRLPLSLSISPRLR